MTLSRTSRLAAALAAMVTLATIPQMAFSQGTVPEIVARAARVNEAALSGTVVHHRHITIAVAAGPTRYNEQNEALVVIENGAFKHVRYTKVMQNGKAFSASDLARRDDEINRELQRGSGFFKQPFDRRYFGDYTYGPQAPCAGRADASEITFHSLVRDDAHGDGTMRVESASGRIIDVTYTPNVLPNHASNGTTTETFGEPLGGMWTIVRIDRTYAGRVAFFKGNGRVTETLDGFHQFGNVEEGLAFVRSYGD